MLNKIFATTWKDLKILFKDIGGIATLFLMPLMFILVMSTALQGLFNTGVDAEPERLPVINLDQGDYAEEIISALDDMDGIEVESTWQDELLTREMAENLILDGERQIAFVFPADFSANVDARAEGSTAEVVVEMVTDPALSVSYLAPIQGMVQGVAERVAETEIAQIDVEKSIEEMMAALPEQARINIEDFSISQEESSVVELKQISPANMNVEIEPDTYQQNVPGYTTMGVFFIVGILATSLLTEKKEGTFRRLLVAPFPRFALLAGKLIPYYFVNLIQVAIMFTTAHLFFGMAFGDPLALLVLSLALAAAATGLGLMVAAFCKTDTQIGGLTSLLTLTMSALGGCLMPTFIMPEFLQKVSRLIPHAWAMQGFQDVLVRGYGVMGILPESGVLLAFAMVFFLIGVWRFRFD
jgi:ABC-2 type transport system permease protein